MILVFFISGFAFIKTKLLLFSNFFIFSLFCDKIILLLILKQFDFLLNGSSFVVKFK